MRFNTISSNSLVMLSLQWDVQWDAHPVSMQRVVWSDTTTIDPNAEGGWEAATGLESLMNEMDTDYCDNMQPNVARCNKLFLWYLSTVSDGWRGEEQWILPNRSVDVHRRRNLLRHGRLMLNKEKRLDVLLVTSHLRSMVRWTDKTDCPRRIVGKRRTVVHNLQCSDRRWKLDSYTSKVMATWLDLDTQQTTPLISYLK